ncbi:hypothetical protein [Marinobacter sp.]|uniref:hypothetical protein n=1 Tax=Marinobacter sp. TaxID=50741 RepID=UPI00356A910C
MRTNILRVSVFCLAATAAFAASAESIYQVERAGGVDATGGNEDGSLRGYRSKSFSDLASLTAPNLSQMQDQVTNLTQKVENNYTSMQDLITRIQNNEVATSNALGAAQGAQATADTALSRANSAYARADAAYNKATSAQSQASSAYSLASQGPNVYLQDYTHETGRSGDKTYYCRVKLVVDGSVKNDMLLHGGKCGRDSLR